MKYNDNGIWKDLTVKVSDTLPVGTIIPYAGTTIPSNYMLCEGQELSRIEYDILFSAIGTTYGVGDGSTTFNLPNLKGRVVVGVDSNDEDFDTLGETGGEKEHTLTINEMPSHKHGIRDTTDRNTQAGQSRSAIVGGGKTWNEGDTYLSANTGGGQPHNNLQPYQVLNYIIKVLDAPAIQAQVVNGYSTSSRDSYSCNYVNNKVKDVYSTDEVKTNKVWIDNKPIYRKVVDLGSLGTQTQISYGNQIDTITSFGGYLYQDNGGNMSLIEYTSSLWRAITYTITSHHTMNVLINRSNTSVWEDWKLKIVIEYTKTTD